MTADWILVVEDDPALGANLIRALSNAGHDARLAPSAAAARAVDTPPALVLLDLGLPDADGLDLLRELSGRWPDLRVVVLTARADELDVVIGLDAGAADYVTKPFRLAELLARVRAQLRLAPRQDGSTLTDGGLEIDLARRRVRVADAEVELRTKEFDLLVALVRGRGRVATREDLMSEVWDEHWFGSTKTLDVHVAALRRKLGAAGGPAERIVTLRGVGYRWEPADPEES